MQMKTEYRISNKNVPQDADLFKSSYYRNVYDLNLFSAWFDFRFVQKLACCHQQRKHKSTNQDVEYASDVRQLQWTGWFLLLTTNTVLVLVML